MNYIILDMEWDSAYYVPQKRFINQILQIGAVKLDSDFNITDTLELNIRSAFTSRVSRRFTELTGITKEMMLSGIPFAEAVKKYNEFTGEGSITMTWSNSDLYTIIENEVLLPEDCRFKIDRYLDLQKFIQNELKLSGVQITSQISLAHAAEMLDIKTVDYDFHTAKDDSIVCALLLKHCYNGERFKSYVIDATDPHFREKLSFKAFYIADMNSPDIPEETFDFKCPACGKPLKTRSKWHFHNRNFTAELSCGKCGKKYIGRVTARKTYEDVKIRTKLIEKRPKVEKKNDMQPLPEKV